MTITFRVDDGHDTLAIPSAIITHDQLGALRTLLAEQGARLGVALIVSDYGEPGAGAFGFEARVCPLALATVSACFDHDPAVITVLDEAQFRGRRVRVWQSAGTADVWVGLASSLDAAPELEVSSSNGLAILEMLGLDTESVGAISVAELRQRLTDPRIRRRIDDEPGLARYLPTLIEMAAVKPVAGELHLAWA